MVAEDEARRFREDFARALEVAERWEEAHAVVVGLAREVPDRKLLSLSEAAQPTGYFIVRHERILP